MATTITAGDLSNPAIISSDTTGAVVIQTGAAGAKVNALSISAAGVIKPLDSAWPVFRAYRSASQTVSAATWTKLQAGTEEFDTANAFDATTNYRFQPAVAGYYQINITIFCSGSTNVTSGLAQIWKNGAAYGVASAGVFGMGATGGGISGSHSQLVYLNGSTDYVEAYGYVQGSGTLGFTGDITGALVRAA